MNYTKYNLRTSSVASWFLILQQIFHEFMKLWIVIAFWYTANQFFFALTQLKHYRRSESGTKTWGVEIKQEKETLVGL